MPLCCDDCMATLCCVVLLGRDAVLVALMCCSVLMCSVVALRVRCRGCKTTLTQKRAPRVAPNMHPKCSNVTNKGDHRDVNQGTPQLISVNTYLYLFISVNTYLNLLIAVDLC